MIVATAGHVDHGKTTLIKALTGVDTDRLPEEKKRGLSIDLGFAFLTPRAPEEDFETIGFIDVPGHEKFIRNMIAGVGSIDVSLLVVAADDGPMPQTKEHLAILQLLGVRNLIVVMTKADIVDADRLDQVTQELKALIKESVFESVPLLSVPAGDQGAVEKLRAMLIQLSADSQKGADNGRFRLAIDRSFIVTGAGTVVTGTVMSGVVSVEDTLHLLSTKTPLRVRGLHAQNRPCETAFAGQRCAINVSGSGLKNTIFKRGDWLVAEGSMQSERMLDVSLIPAPLFKTDSLEHVSDGIRHWTPAHLHLATASVPCRIALLEGKSVASGEWGLARLICDQAVGAVNGDRFVLRDQSARYTIAGGVVIDPAPPRRGRSHIRRIELLRAMNQPLELRYQVGEQSGSADRIDAALDAMLNVSEKGIDLNKFCAQFNCQLQDILDRCKSRPLSLCEYEGQWWCILLSHQVSLAEQLLNTLKVWHDGHPNSLGATAEQINRTLPERYPLAVLIHTLDAMVDDKSLIRKAAVYASPEWSSVLDSAHEAYWKKLSQIYSESAATAPRVGQLAEALDLSVEDLTQLLNTFVAHGSLYRVSANRYYTPELLYPLAAIAEKLATDNDFTVAAFRDESGVGRNLVIELLEFFDRSRFTRRIGQQRSLVRSAEAVFGQER